MTDSPNIVGLYIGLFLGLLYLLFMLVKYRTPPEFMKVAIVILSVTGAVMGIDLSFMALTVTDESLGGFADQRIAIVIGALPITWTAVETTVNTFKESLSFQHGHHKKLNPK
ncbi:hypothetical protein [Moritella viscosa]|uniref:Integron gene cassette protein n=1 Tax=Moritella viscosa TaxID=80854 RepID=A0ABY1HMC6_9GAMM|nr:hypothetical protein [Moritella viscosa]SGZ01873.1 Putative integron gene cassette protein [Moritella viscosa]